MASHDYLVQRLHEARATDFQAEARDRRLLKEAKRALRRLAAPSVVSFRHHRPATLPGSEQENGSEAA